MLDWIWRLVGEQQRNFSFVFVGGDLLASRGGERVGIDFNDPVPGLREPIAN